MAKQKTNYSQSEKGEIGYAEKNSSQGSINSTTIVDLTSLSVTVTVPSGATIKITGWVPQIGSNVATDRVDFHIREGSTSLAILYAQVPANGGPQTVMVRLQPTAGSHTYKLSVARGVGTGSIGVYADATTKGFILVEII